VVNSFMTHGYGYLHVTNIWGGFEAVFTFLVLMY
jgi:hypothetical protein